MEARGGGRQGARSGFASCPAPFLSSAEDQERGTCFGDSGGPVFYGDFESTGIVGVTSFGLSPTCSGVDFAYRTDRKAVINWILRTIPKSELDDIEFVSP